MTSNLVWKNDLPERLDPMTAKELRQSLRRGSFVIPFLTIQVLAVAATMVEFKSGAGSSGPDMSGVLNFWNLLSSGPFWWVAGGVCLVLMPMGGLALMGQELDEGNHELLLLTKLDRWKVVIGKFLTLWGLCVLTFISLLPYVVVRYLIGGIEWTHEAACAGTVIGGSAMMCAGAIGASAFRRTAVKFAVAALFLASIVAGCGVPLLAAGGVTHGCGWLYHLTALSGILCYSIAGLALARSRLRLSVLEYEVSPTNLIVGFLIFAPFVIGMVTAFTVGFGGWFGLLGMTLVAAKMDITPKAPKWVPAPPPEIPEVVR